MSGILNRWRQFGRRYFWPHLLLGMVAAGFGLPTSQVNAQEATPVANSTTSINQFSIAGSGFHRLSLLQEAHRRPAFSVDYWQQHALRVVIRHLSFAIAPVQPFSQTETLEVQHQVLLATLNALLMSEPKLPVIVRVTHQQPSSPMTAPYQAGLWLAGVVGIRAGPSFIL